MSSSQHQILRATSIVGVASMLNIVIGLGRTKIAALLLGPKGIGEIGLFLNLIQLAATLGAVSLGTSAVRQIADARGRDDAAGVAAAHRALIWTSVGLAMASGSIFWALQNPIMRYMAMGTQFSPAFSWLAAAVSLTILSSVPVALLIGHRRVADQALVQIVGALIGTIIGIGILLVWREDGIIAYTVVAPAAMLFSGMLIARRLPKVEQPWNQARTLTQSRAMLGLGFPLMVGAISVTGGMLALRSLLQHRLGPVGLGQFTAAWTLCVTYVGFVMQAMATDYFPRLSAVIHNHAEARRVVNEQIEAMLLIGLPVILEMQALSPWLLHLLYSSQFSGALEVVRWQILGDVFKIASAPLSYVILSKGKGRLFWLVETSSIIVLVAVAGALLPLLGLKASGIGYCFATASYLPLVYIISRQLIGFSLEPKITRLLFLSLATTSLVALVSTWWAPAGMVVGTILAAVASLNTIRSLGIASLMPSAIKRYIPARLIDAGHAAS